MFIFLVVGLLLLYFIALSIWDMRRPGRRRRLLLQIAVLCLGLAVVIWVMAPRHGESPAHAQSVVAAIS
jgi:drug/metabolite transporter (DMT)-like permease